MRKITHIRLGLIILTALLATTVSAQRKTDHLGRGLVAVPTGSTSGSTTNFVSWRRLAEEYYDVTYNLYRDGTLIASGLKKPSYDDSKCSNTSSYQVAAVVNGVVQAKSAAMKPWTQYVYKYTVRCPTGYIDIALQDVYDRGGVNVTNNYEPNDAEMADLDGDGELEIIIKRLNTYDAANLYPQNSTQFVVFDAYDVNWQTGAAKLMWRIDCGPNMVSLNSTEVNLIAFDWDEDGCAEVVLRGADDMIVHYFIEGKEYTQSIGTAGRNYREASYSSDQFAWTKTGDEYLIYMNGTTGKPYQVITYPLLRLEPGETSLKTAWGDDYGHRSSKYFFGAPYLDGKKPSLFLARGIYTRHKMIALDINASNHTFTTRWTWNCNTSSSQWYGNGYHNFIIADVDEDGRDEIVYGSMVIDDNGKGLSTTGYGHGDSQNVGDLDPYRPGLEFMGCLEEGKANYGCNYRNATTSEIYRKEDAGGDTGRSLMANLSNNYPGSIGRSSSGSVFSAVTDESLGLGDEYLDWADLNFRIYWDGDLLSEVFNSPGTAREAKVEKPGTGRLFTSSGCNLNNDSKNNACFIGDIIGDWREEMVVKCGRNLRVYTTGMSTQHDIYTLWHDHQYRQAIAWQMMAYNQAPYLSYFLGELEGITVAPPPLTLTGREVVSNGASITTAHNGKHLLMSDQTDMSVTVANGAMPYIITDNAPAWVQGHDNNSNITTTTYTHTINGAPLTGSMRLVKQGNGILRLSNNTHTYSGETRVWGGTLEFDGTLTNSSVTMGRFTTLKSDGGVFNKSITMEYGAAITPGGNAKASSIETGSLMLGFGSRVVFDINGEEMGDNDLIKVGTLTIERKTEEAWVNYGPKYLAPVFQFVDNGRLKGGRYPIAEIQTLAQGSSISDIIIEGLNADATLTLEDGVLYLVLDLPTVTASTISVLDMMEVDLSGEYPSTAGQKYYLPKVGLSVENVNGITPTITGYFTDLTGNTTQVGGTGSLTQYAFTQPGTLTIVTSAIGYNDNEVTYEVLNPYMIIYESKDFSKIMASEAANELGTDLWGTNVKTSRWSGWANGSYTMVEAFRNTKMYVDDKRVLWANIKIGHPGNRLLTLIEGYGIGQQQYYSDSGSDGLEGTVIHAAGLGDASTIIYHKYDTSRGNTNTTYIEGYLFADDNGCYDFDSGNSNTLMKFIAYAPTVINDEMAISQPLGVTNSFAHLYRTELTGVQNWSAMVLPYFMTYEQLQDAFGSNVMVANFVTDKSQADVLYFETVTQQVSANMPFLIKGVEKTSPYIIKGITALPAMDPTQTGEYYLFIGTYDDKDMMEFTQADYFISNKGLTSVSGGKQMLPFHGYRAYFHALDGSTGMAPRVVFDDADGVSDIEYAGNRSYHIYNVAGQLVKRDADSTKGLPRGVYIVNGKAVIVR